LELKKNMNRRATASAYGFDRFMFVVLLFGQVWFRLLMGKTYWHKISEHMFKAGPASLLPVVCVNGLGGMIFTIQTARQLGKFGAINSVGGMFAIAFCRELAPILTATIFAGQVGSAFAAELGAMKVGEQIDALHTLRTNPIDYLVLPRMIACGLMMPILIVFALVCGICGGTIAATQFYQLPPIVFLESIRTFLNANDAMGLWLKGLIFGTTIAIIGCGWGLSTSGGVKQVGESATAATVVAGVTIFVIDLLLSLLLFHELPIGS
jgi:phospholipid/cholesterol/gamma-HCH transport system permease protein